MAARRTRGSASGSSRHRRQRRPCRRETGGLGGRRVARGGRAAPEHRPAARAAEVLRGWAARGVGRRAQVPGDRRGSAPVARQQRAQKAGGRRLGLGDDGAAGADAIRNPAPGRAQRGQDVRRLRQKELNAARSLILARPRRTGPIVKSQPRRRPMSKLIPRAGALVLAASLLAGCGGGKGSSSASTATTAPTASVNAAIAAQVPATIQAKGN